MAKVADVKLSWKKSPSADVDRIQVVVNNGGTETTSDFGPEVEEMMVVVKASSGVTFKVVTFDSEGQQTTSALYTFSIGDLEAPLPATNLSHQIIAIRDDAPAPSEPPAGGGEAPGPSAMRSRHSSK